MIDVNLLPSQNVLSQKEKDLRRKLKIGLIISSALAVVVVLFLMIFDGFLSLRLGQQKQKQQELLAQFQKEMPAALDLRKLKDKISGIKTAQKGQIDFAGIAGEVAPLFNSGVILKTLSIDKDKNINLTAAADSLTSLEVFIPTLKTPFEKIVLSGLRLGKNNNFDFSLSMTYGLKKT
ncbi:hypothetical protein HY085_01815 [Candidatus Gottesmanbacteria bacterium]|nr:hypothetical protein [Candidatus Gottesmanbacteria bacterium]